ncbi:MAG: UTP--glucose-1-phosphate uridylyltransferase [Epsilonproteobacteria bacterium]|nr:MAG: UTP--glucose-1-phosphate uridylyltransferase [Campylobacterota bacterium]
MSEIRYDRLNDTYVIIAPERLRRPDCTVQTHKEELTTSVCPFCEGNELMTPPEIYALREKESFANESGWQTRVVPNLYKAVQIEVPHQHHFSPFEHWEGFGAHEVIIDTPHHHTSMTQWSESEVENWLKTLRVRVSDLRQDHRIAFISLFKNEGVRAGATQTHSHTQLIGLPIIPNIDRDLYRRTYEHYQRHGSSLLSELLVEEEQAEERIIQRQGEFTAFCPYASAYPFEVMISSKKALGQIDTLSDHSINEISVLLLNTLKKMKRQLECFDFNLSVATPPLYDGAVERNHDTQVDEVCRFAIRITPRIYTHGGFEISSGVMINPVAPEQAAKLLRESSDD